MTKSIAVISLILGLGASAAFAAPTSFLSADGGTTSDGREYSKKMVQCSENSREHEVLFFKGIKKWCLNDESYCNRKIMKVAKKSCKQK